jgi:hypothetical protein
MFKPLQPQSMAMNRYDFVIATNVLHPTPDIRETVRNAKALLKREGVLLLNEMSGWSLAIICPLVCWRAGGCTRTRLRLPGSPGLTGKVAPGVAGRRLEGVCFGHGSACAGSANCRGPQRRAGATAHREAADRGRVELCPRLK